MNEQDFRALQADYIDSHGLVTVEPHSPPNSTGNGILHLGLYLAELNEYGWLKTSDITQALDTLNACSVRVEGIRLPIFWRTPDKKNADDSNAHDDYLGVAITGLHPHGISLCDALVDYAKRYYWCFNNQSPGTFRLKFWHGWRLPWRAHLKIATTDGIGLMEELSLAISILLHFPQERRSDACIHTWLSIHLSRRKSPLCRLAGKVWERRTRKKFGSIGNSFTGYFKSAIHPLCLLP